MYNQASLDQTKQRTLVIKVATVVQGSYSRGKVEQEGTLERGSSLWGWTDSTDDDMPAIGPPSSIHQLPVAGCSPAARRSTNPQLRFPFFFNSTTSYRPHIHHESPKTSTK